MRKSLLTISGLLHRTDRCSDADEERRTRYSRMCTAPSTVEPTRSEVAEAIMTSDTRRKEIGGRNSNSMASTVRIGGICKGAGMIQPRMSRRTRGLHATMLAFITSDVAINSCHAEAGLADAVEHSFNRITVDGDMSTNDSVISAG